MLADLLGKPIAGVDRHSHRARPEAARRRRSPSASRRCSAEHPEVDACEGVGVVVPGMVEHSTMRVLHAPTLGWRDVDLREPLAAATGLPVQIENSGRACALAQVWAMRDDGAPRRFRLRQRLGRPRRRRDDQRRGAARPAQHRRRVRSRAAVARRPALLLRRERLLGGLRLEPRHARPLLRPAAISDAGPVRRDPRAFTVDDLIARARARRRQGGRRRSRPRRAISAWAWPRSSTRSIPARVYIGGEITLAWDLIEATVRSALAERALTPAAAGPNPAGRRHRVSAVARRGRAGRRAGVRRAGRGLRQPWIRDETTVTDRRFAALSPEHVHRAQHRRAARAAPHAVAPGSTAPRATCATAASSSTPATRRCASTPASARPGFVCLRGIGHGHRRTAAPTRWIATTRSTCRASRGRRSRPAPSGCDLAEIAAPVAASIRCSSCGSPTSAGSRPALRRRRPAAKRELNVLIGKNVEAGRIMAGVTFSEPGNWTSWPPHEHAACSRRPISTSTCRRRPSACSWSTPTRASRRSRRSSAKATSC